MKERPVPTRDDAVNAVDIANDLHNDLLSAAAMWRSLMKARDAGIVEFKLHIVERVVTGHMVISIHKADDLLTHRIYATLFGTFAIDWRRAVRRQIESTQLRELRNRYMGHIHYGDRGRPMYTSELDALRKKITDGDMNNFVRWAAEDDQSVMMLMLSLRNYLAEKHEIKSGEILNR